MRLVAADIVTTTILASLRPDATEPNLGCGSFASKYKLAFAKSAFATDTRYRISGKMLSNQYTSNLQDVAVPVLGFNDGRNARYKVSRSTSFRIG